MLERHVHIFGHCNAMSDVEVLLINVSRQGPMLMANGGCCVATLITDL